VPDMYHASIVERDRDRHEHARFVVLDWNRTYPRSIGDEYPAVWDPTLLCLLRPCRLHHHAAQANAVLDEAATDDDPRVSGWRWVIHPGFYFERVPRG
jgi:hypothetical protein